MSLSHEMFGKITPNQNLIQERKQSSLPTFQIPSIPKGVEIHFNLKDSFNTKPTNMKVTKDEDRWNRFENEMEAFSRKIFASLTKEKLRREMDSNEPLTTTWENIMECLDEKLRNMLEADFRRPEYARLRYFVIIIKILLRNLLILPNFIFGVVYLTP